LPLRDWRDCTWRDAAEFLLLVAVRCRCARVMHYGYRIVEDMAEGWTTDAGESFKTLEDFAVVAQSRDGVETPELNYKIVRTLTSRSALDAISVTLRAGTARTSYSSGPRYRAVDGHVELHPIPAVRGGEPPSIAETPVTRKERAAAFAQGPTHAARANSRLTKRNAWL